jgi:hypothetical protein
MNITKSKIASPFKSISPNPMSDRSFSTLVALNSKISFYTPHNLLLLYTLHFTMASSSTKDGDGDGCTIEHICNEIDDNFSFLPDEMKNRYISERVRKHVVLGQSHLLGTSPRAKKLKVVIERSQQHMLEESSCRFISDAVTVYINQKNQKRICPSDHRPLQRNPL